MAQIVSARINEEGNFVLEVRPLPSQRLSMSKENVHIAGTTGWAEALIGLTTIDPEGNQQQLFATVDIRYRNPYAPKKEKKSKTLSVEDLKGGTK